MDFLAPLHFTFMQHAIIAGIVIAIIAPYIGTFLVVRRYAYMADTLAHVSLVGVALGLLLGVEPVIGAIAAAVVAALGIEQLRTTSTLFGEATLALFLSGSLAIAAVLLSLGNGFTGDLMQFLFGSITTVTRTDVWIIVGLGIVVVAAMSVFYKQLFAVTLHEELAQAEGIRARQYHRLLVLLAAITVGLAMRIVGVLLIGALMVVPVMTALQLGRGFRATIFIGIIASLIATLVGLFLSYFFDLAPGGTIVVVSLVLFVLSLFVRRR